jgi:hypothetical protein
MAGIIAAVIGGTAAVAGGLIASGGAKSAANTQAQASREAQAAQERQYQQQVALQEPFRQAGLTAQEQIMQLLGIGGDKAAQGYGSLAKPFGADQFQQDPGYAFRQAEGMKALERSAAARGGLLSGGTLKGIQRFGQDLASQEYGNAFNRYQTERAARLNPLQSLMGAGQSAVNTLTSAAGQAGQNEAANLYNAGQARASGYVGSANALSGALSGIGNAAQNYQQGQLLNSYINQGGGFGGRTGVTMPTSFGLGNAMVPGIGFGGPALLPSGGG